MKTILFDSVTIVLPQNVSTNEIDEIFLKLIDKPHIKKSYPIRQRASCL